MQSVHARSFPDIEIMRRALHCICCAGLLWSVTPKLVWFLFLYAGIGTYVTTSAFGKRLMQLHFATVQREGDLRFGMVRTRENAGMSSLSSQLQILCITRELLLSSAFPNHCILPSVICVGQAFSTCMLAQRVSTASTSSM